MVIIVFLAIKFAYICSNNFYGFQWQPNLPTIEEAIKKALLKANISFNDVTSAFEYAGRTDKGVHAWDQTIKISLDINVIPQRILYRINAHLPKNVISWAYSEVNENFSPRFHAESRTYSYMYVCQDTSKFDLESMKIGALKLIGTHNFRNFCKNDPTVNEYKRKLTSIQITPLNENSIIYFKIIGQSFLWQQVRRTVSHLIELGNHTIKVDETELLLENKSKRRPMPLPAEGLILENITYPSITRNYEIPIIQKFQNNLSKEVISIKQDLFVLNHITLLQDTFVRNSE